MKTLIVAATAAEIAPSIPLLTDKKVDYLITGVGMVATAFQMGRIHPQHYDLLLNVGIAGTFDQQHDLGTLFRIQSDQIYRFGAQNDSAFLPIEDLGFGDRIFHEQLPPGTISDLLKAVPGIDAITVNCVHGHHPSILRVIQEHGSSLLESMEGAAFFYASQLLGLPRVQIRSVSNLVEKRNQKNWNIALAIAQLNQWLQQYVKALP